MPVGRAIVPTRDWVYMEADMETEDLEYVKDTRIRRSRSKIVGNVIMLGTSRW